MEAFRGTANPRSSCASDKRASTLVVDNSAAQPPKGRRPNPSRPPWTTRPRVPVWRVRRIAGFHGKSSADPWRWNRRLNSFHVLVRTAARNFHRRGCAPDASTSVRLCGIDVLSFPSRCRSLETHATPPVTRMARSTTSVTVPEGVSQVQPLAGFLLGPAADCRMPQNVWKLSLPPFRSGATGAYQVHQFTYRFTKAVKALLFGAMPSIVHSRLRRIQQDSANVTADGTAGSLRQHKRHRAAHASRGQPPFHCLGICTSSVTPPGIDYVTLCAGGGLGR